MIEKEFANGYLFGELLYRLDMIKDYSKFQDSNNTKVVEQNFGLLKEPLASFKYDAERIQKAAPGAALKLLYDIKLKREGTSEKISPERVTGKIEKKTMTGRDFTTQKLNEKLGKFQEVKTELYKRAAESKALEQTMKAQSVKEKMNQGRQTLKENKKFMQDWTNKGMKNWYKNRQKRREVIEKQLKYEQSVVDKYRTGFENRRIEGEKEVKEGIDFFERNLQRLGIDIKEQVIDDNEERKDRKKQPFSLVSTMTKIRERKTLADFARKEKDRRQRKTQVDQAKTQEEIQRAYKETEILNRLQKSAIKYRTTCYNMWRDSQYKNFLGVLAKKAEEEHKARANRQIAEFLAAKEIENRELFIKTKADMQITRKKFAEIERLKKRKRRELFTKVMQTAIIPQLLDIVNESYKKQLASDTKQVNIKDWEQWMKAFISGENIIPGSVTAYITQSKPGWSHLGLAEEQDMEKYEMCDYMQSLGLWDPELVIRDASQVKEEYGDLETSLTVCENKEELSIESSEMWKWYNKIRGKLKGITEEDKEPEVKIEEALSYVPVKLVLCGKRFTPKKEIATELENKYNIRTLKPKTEIKRLTKLIQEEIKAKEEKKEETKLKGKVKQDPNIKNEEINPELRKIVEGIMNLPISDSETELDELEAKFVIEWIRQTYPKSSQEYYNDLKARIKRKKEIETELVAMQEEAQAKKGGKVNVKKEQELNNELKELNKSAEKGFLLINFPKNYNQAKMLQEAMVPHKLEDVKKEPADLKQAKDLSGYLSDPRKVDWVVPSAIDGIVVVDITRAECKNRGKNRKKKEDKDEYWFEGYSEQCEDKLVDAPVESEKLERAYWKSAGNDKDLLKFEDFYSRFEPKIVDELKSKVWHRINGMNTKEKIVEDVNELVDVWMEIHKKNEEKLIAQIEQELQAEAKPEVKEELKEETQEEIKKEDTKKEDQPEGSKDQKQEEAKSYQEEEKQTEEIMAENWAKVNERYPNTMNLIFKFYRKQKSILVSGLTEMHRQFIAFFERPDDKQSLLDGFLSKLNTLLADHPDYIENPSALKEIFQNLDELGYRMWKITEKKKDDAIAEREDKINSSTILV